MKIRGFFPAAASATSCSRATPPSAFSSAASPRGVGWPRGVQAGGTCGRPGRQEAPERGRFGKSCAGCGARLAGLATPPPETAMAREQQAREYCRWWACQGHPPTVPQMPCPPPATQALTVHVLGLDVAPKRGGQLLEHSEGAWVHACQQLASPLLIGIPHARAVRQHAGRLHRARGKQAGTGTNTEAGWQPRYPV